MQVVGMPAWNKNVHVGNGTLSGAEDIREAEANLVSVPGPYGQGRNGHTVDILDEPDDEGGIEQADERSDAQDGGLLSRLRVGEAEQLFCFPKKNLDTPSAGIGLQYGANVERGIEREEDPVGHGARVGGDDDDPQKARAGRAVPLGAEGLELHSRLAPVEGGFGRLPGCASVAGDLLGLAQQTTAFAWAPSLAAVARRWR